MKVIKNSDNNYTMINPLTTVNRINLYKTVNKENQSDVMLYLLMTRIIADYTNRLDVVSFRQYKAQNYDLRTLINSYDFDQKIVIEYSVEYIDNLVKQDIVLDILNQIIDVNIINEEMIAQKRDDLITEIETIKDNPQSEIRNLFSKTIYQDALNVEEMINSLKKITAQDLITGLDKVNQASVFLQINYQQVNKQVDSLATSSINQYFNQQTLNHTIDDEVIDSNNNQANLMLGYKIDIELSREEKIMFNAVFGNGADSLLFKIIREQHHLCYSVNSMLMENNILGVYVGLDQDKLDFCIKEINKILTNIANNQAGYDLASTKQQVVDKLMRNADKFSYNKQQILNHVLFGYEYQLDKIIEKINLIEQPTITNIANNISYINKVIIK